VDPKWTIGNISCTGLCKDSGGYPALRATSYRVELSSGKERLNVGVAVTHVASRYAMSCREGDSPNDYTCVEAVEQDLVRCFVDEKLSDADSGWNPERTPWLTIDSEEVQVTVERLACLEAAQ
jgi:hypothetical protein